MIDPIEYPNYTTWIKGTQENQLIYLFLAILALTVIGGLGFARWRRRAWLPPLRFACIVGYVVALTVSLFARAVGIW